MEVINLATRKEIEVMINGKACVMSLSLKNIHHFQETNNIGLQLALEKMKKGDVKIAMKLIYSMVSDKKTGKILGDDFFKRFDEIAILNSLSPYINKLLENEMPLAKNQTEKKYRKHKKRRR